MTRELLDRSGRIFVGIHLQRSLASLRQTEHALTEGQISRAPDGISGVDDCTWLSGLRVPDLYCLVQRTSDELVAPIVGPVNAVNLCPMGSNALNRQRPFLWQM